MHPTHPELGTENQGLYQVHSRGEIIRLLNGIADQHQLVTMIIHGGAEIVVTSILEVNDNENRIYLDCAQNNLLNQRIIESDNIEFESSLDKVRILFSAIQVTECMQDGQPALCIDIPGILIRLQRREYFRVNIPAGFSNRCMIPHAGETYNAMMVDISGGGVALLDEQKILKTETGHVYEDCQIKLADIGLLQVNLQIRNWQDISLSPGKNNRRIGCQFIGLSPAMLTLVQRYIMQLERERNARMTGLL
ncbi:MAG TPA: flagellar brake protein [Burkholderiales bacterium]|nr:flagellar brake protein [Burkholderiales bacterium]